MDLFTRSFLLLFVLLNPFILSIYLIDLVRTLDARTYRRQVVRAGLISTIVFWIFAVVGDAVFDDLLQVRFASFLIFGGITFLIIGIRLILGLGPGLIRTGADAGEPSASIAMPLMIGPGTISASVVTGTRLGVQDALLVIFLALAVAVAAILLFKHLHDFVQRRHEPLVRRYLEIAGRVTALFVGSFAIEMIMTGLQDWMEIWRTAG